MVMIVQIPLVQRRRHRGVPSYGISAAPLDAEASMDSPPSAVRRRGSGGRAQSNVEAAVIGHGEDLGPYREMGHERLVRDTRFPVRITVQFYRATSNGVVSNEDLRNVHEQIERVYADGDFVGSLVVPRSQRIRPTDWLRHRRPRARRPIPRHRRWGRWHRPSPDQTVQVGPYVF